MDGTIIGQGSFTQGATAVAQTIVIPSNVDSLEIHNFTQAAATSGNGFEFYWQRGMPSGKGIVYLSGAAHAVTVNQTAAGAFTLYDPTAISPLGANNNGSTGVSGFTAANPAVVTVGSTAGMAAGNIVRFNTLDNQPQYSGIDFSVGYGTLTGTTFSVDYLNAIGSIPSTSGNFRVVQVNPLFYPRYRVITNITAAAQAVITLSVDHGFTVGQEVRLSFPGGTLVFGNYAALDGVQAVIVAVDTATGVNHNTITVNVDTSGFGTFNFPAAGLVPFSPALVVPMGEDTATSLSSLVAQVPIINGVQIPNTNVGDLADSAVNTAYLGMTLAAGAALPAGSANDVIFWVARKATFGGI